MTLREKPTASINDLAKMFDVSAMTIRRDLSLLAENGIVDLKSGGARINVDSELFRAVDRRYSLATENSRCREEKIRIGQKAVEFMDPDDIVIIDVGSTTEYLARAVPEDIRCTVLCYSLNALVELHRKENCGVIFAGGFYHANTMMFESPEGVTMIERIRANKAFVSAAGISDRLGVTCANEHELDTKRAILGSSLTRILVADSSKFDKVRPTLFAELEDFNVVITDSGIHDRYHEICKELDITLHVV
jgi:DeoR family transcriptional regulator, deoxyribose operon repressor